MKKILLIILFSAILSITISFEKTFASAVKICRVKAIVLKSKPLKDFKNSYYLTIKIKESYYEKGHSTGRNCFFPKDSEREIKLYNIKNKNFLEINKEIDLRYRTIYSITKKGKKVSRSWQLVE